VQVIYPGQTVSVPNGNVSINSAINPDDYVVDADNNGDKVFVTAITG
jgi:hypothetical protein